MKISKLNQREAIAKFILENIESGSLAFRVKNIAKLHFFLDLNFVNQKLKQIIQESSEQEIIDTIQALLNGTLDVENLKQEIASYQSLNSDISTIEGEYKDKLKTLALESNPQLKLFKSKASDISIAAK